MGFALSRTIVYWGFDCAEDSIPFTRSTSPPFIYCFDGAVVILILTMDSACSSEIIARIKREGPMNRPSSSWII